MRILILLVLACLLLASCAQEAKKNISFVVRNQGDNDSNILKCVEEGRKMADRKIFAEIGEYAFSDVVCSKRFCNCT